MGFKRTAEGRVFFDNPKDEPEEHPLENKDIQILGLLRALNDRLKEEKAERSRLLRELAEYREMVDELEDRTGRSEQAYIDLEQKLSERQNENAKKASRAESVAKETLKEVLETRHLLSEMQEKTQLSNKSFSVIKAQLDETRKIGDAIRKRQAVLEKLHKEQNEKMVGSVAAYVALTKRLTEAEMRFEQLDNKIEETSIGQQQLQRKLEKAGEERVRLLRKMDRIEETVIQTRDALNSKAMVVLADQGRQTAAPEPSLAARHGGEQAKLEKPDTAPFAWLSNIKGAPATGLATVVLAVILSAVFLFFIEAGGPMIDRFSADQGGEEAWRPVYHEDAAREGSKPRIIYGRPQASREPVWDETMAFQQASNLQEPVEAAEKQAVPDPARAADIPDDIGTLDINDEEKLLAALENDPDEVAAMMNAIEPGREPEAVEIEQASLNTEDLASVPPQPAPVQSVEEAVSESARKEEALPPLALSPRPGLRNRIQPDPGLPYVIRKIEEQAFAGVAEAQHDLAAIYTAGHGGTKQDYKKAAMWFREAAEGGVANARYNLGVLYHQGMGVKRDVKEAIRWYESAAELGHPEAQYNLGIAYIEGIGVGYEPRKAAHYFENAADEGITEAAYNLGLIYENGLLGKAEPDVALMWYKTAADKGSPEAKTALEQLAKSLDIGISDVNKIAESMIAAKNKESAARKSAEKVVAIKPSAGSSPAPKTASTQVSTPVLQVPAPKAVSAVSQKQSLRSMTAEVQKNLMQLGLYPGPADGLGGPLTEDAIRSYQIFHEINVDGRVSEELLTYMKGDPQINEVGSREQ